MGRKAAKFTEADITRVLKAAKKAGLQARIDLINGTIEVGEGLLSPGASATVGTEMARQTRMKGIVL